MVKYKKTLFLIVFFNKNTRTYDLLILSGWSSALYFERNKKWLYVVSFLLNFFFFDFLFCCGLLFFVSSGIWIRLKNRTVNTDTSSFNLIEIVRNIVERRIQCVCFAVCRLRHSGMYLLHNSSISPSLSKWSSRKQS